MDLELTQSSSDHLATVGARFGLFAGCATGRIPLPPEAAPWPPGLTRAAREFAIEADGPVWAILAGPDGAGFLREIRAWRRGAPEVVVEAWLIQMAVEAEALLVTAFPPGLRTQSRALATDLARALGCRAYIGPLADGEGRDG